MALDYKSWVAAMRRQGKIKGPTTAAHADQWKRTHGAALGKYNKDGSPIGSGQDAALASGASEVGGAPQQQAKPEFVPGVLDARGIAEIADLTYGRKIADAGADRDKESDLAEIAAQRIDADRSRDMGLRDNLRSMAARGTRRSGINVENQGEIHNERLRQEGAFARATTAINNRWKTAKDQNEFALRQGSTASKFNADERRMIEWQNNNPDRGGGEPVQPASPAPAAPAANPGSSQAPAAPNAPGSTPKPKLTYRQFLDKSWGKGAASNKTRAAAWKRLYGGA